MTQRQFEQILGRLAAVEEKLALLLSEKKVEADDKQWFTVAEASHTSGISEYSWRQACNLGRITDCRKSENGHSWRIHRSAVLAARENGLPKQNT